MITFVSQSRRMTMEQAGVSETKQKRQLFCQSQITAINLALEFNIFFLFTKICFAQHDTIQPEITRSLLAEIFFLPKPCL